MSRVSFGKFLALPMKAVTSPMATVEHVDMETARSNNFGRGYGSA
jgi:hypothetical protein